MFSYTAAFSVAAAMGRRGGDSVDLARRSRNYQKSAFLWQMSLALDAHRFVVMWLTITNILKRHDLSYDVIVLDPPSFARNKKRTFSVAKDYHRLVSEALEFTSRVGP